MKRNNKNNRNTWSAEDRQRFADRNFLKASTVPARRYEGPGAEEWDDIWEDIYAE